MANTATTLAGPIGPSDWLVQLATMAGMNPNDNIVVGTETMRVLMPPNPTSGLTSALVYRGARGTNGQAAAGGATATFGPPANWGVGVGVTNFEREALQPYLDQVAADHAAADEKDAEARKKKADDEASAAAAKAAKADAKTHDATAHDATAPEPKPAHPAAHK